MTIDLESAVSADKETRMAQTLAVLAGGTAPNLALTGSQHIVDWEAVYGIWLRDVKKFTRERSRLWGGIARPILWLLILGSSLRPVVQRSDLGADYTHFIFAGVIALTLVFAAFQSATSVIWDREFGFLKEVLAAPVPRSSVLIGKTLGGATQATMQGIITLLFGPIIGLWLDPLTLVLLVLLMFVIAFALSGMGLLVASRMSSFEGFGAISNFVVMPMYFLSGAIYPTTNLPGWLHALIIINPLSYSVDAMRIIILGQKFGTLPLWGDLLFLAVFTVVMISAAIWQFGRE